MDVDRITETRSNSTIDTIMQASDMATGCSSSSKRRSAKEATEDGEHVVKKMKKEEKFDTREILECSKMIRQVEEEGKEMRFALENVKMGDREFMKYGIMQWVHAVAAYLRYLSQHMSNDIT